MSVIGNLKLGAYLRKDKIDIADDMDMAFELFPRHKERRSQKACSLSGGGQPMLAIGWALMSRLKLLLMDESSLGLAPVVIDHLSEVIRDINKDGISILLVEQNAGLVAKVA